MFGKYSDVEKRYEAIRRRVLQDFPQLTLHMEECVRISYDFHDGMSRDIDGNAGLDGGGNLAKRTAIVHSLYSKNVLYLRSAYQLVLDGHASSPSHLLRAVYEAVLAQYWVSLCNDRSVEKYMQDSMPGQKTPKFNDLKQKLYEGRIFESVGGAYAKLSAYTHPNPIPLDLEYNRDQMRGVVKLLSTLSLYNTLSYSQLYSHFGESTLKTVTGRMDMFVKEMLYQAGYKLDMLFPNRPEFAERLVWQPPRRD